jgi:hypothetical protein
MKYLGQGKSQFFRLLFYVTSTFFLVNMGDGAKRNVMSVEPSYAPLEEGEQSFSATIYDDSTITEILDVSFFGHTSIGGIKKEVDDSTNKLELSKIKELTILKSNVESKRFRDREFSLAKMTAANNTVVDDLLIPKHVIICGIDKKSQMERSWFLSKIDKIVIDQATKKIVAPEIAIEKIFNKEQKKSGSEKEHTTIDKKKEPQNLPISRQKNEPNSEIKKTEITESLKRLWADFGILVSETAKYINGCF